ncbi:MAG: class I SAM-dependent methyltransferase [Anaerolineae bacterium]|nr:class I SAM-dependent methyltransferase [Anaerolineae bacterium]
MMDDVSDIAALYNSDPENENGRLERHQLERDLTWRHLDQYLPPHGSILEIGAATGGYTLPLARRGYTITAVDMSTELLAVCRAKLAAEGLETQVRLVEADARDLAQVTQTDFDAVLLMGPLYHLVLEPDRVQSLRQAYARLRPGGVLFSAFISRYGVLGDVMHDFPDWIEDQADVRSLLANGSRRVDAPRVGFRAYFATTAEIPALHEAVGFETLTLAGVEPAISADDESYNRLQGTQRHLWQDLLFEMSTEPTLIAASRHLLYVGRKVER